MSHHLYRDGRFPPKDSGKLRCMASGRWKSCHGKFFSPEKLDILEALTKQHEATKR